MQKYTENAIAKFDDLIRESDPPVQYSVAVDDLTVVPRTDNPEKFMGHARFVDGETCKVTIKMYHGAGNRNDCTELWLKAPREEGALDGIQQQVLAGIASERKKWEHDRALEKIEELKEVVSDQEKYIGQLESQVEEYRAKKLHVGDLNLLEVLGFVAEGFVKRNPSLIARLPGGEALAGAIMADNQARESPQVEEVPPASFSRATGGSQLDERDATYLALIRELGNQFERDEFARVMGIIGELIDDRQLLPVLEQVIEDRNPETNH